MAVSPPSGGVGARGGLVIICIEASESLIEPMCTTADLQQELVPYVIGQSLKNPAFIKLSKPERQMRVKNLTQKMLSGETGGADEDEDENIAPHRFWNHLRTKYGTRKGHCLQLLKLLEPSIRKEQVVLLRFESEVGCPSASLFVRASSPCSSVTAAVADGARKDFAAGTFSVAALSDWLPDSFSVRRAPPLWSRFILECRRAAAEGFSEIRALVICTAAQSIDTTPDAIGLGAHALHHESSVVPYISSVGFGAQSSERLAAISELCAWSGGHFFNVTDPSTLQPAADGLGSHLFGPNTQAKDFHERRLYYSQKQALGTCYLPLPRLVAADEPSHPLAGSRGVRTAADVLRDNLSARFDGIVPSESMLMVLSETTLAMPRRWGRSLRCWRESRELRDVVFGEPGSLGLELDEPLLADGAPEGQRRWRLRTTHPPASALKMKEGAVLLSINHARIHENTQRSEIARRVAARPVSLTFASPARVGGAAGADVLTEGETFAAVAAEIAVGELREGLRPLKKDAPPLSTATELISRASSDGDADKLRRDQATKVIASVADLGAGNDSSPQVWMSGTSEATSSAGECARSPAVVFRIMLFCGDVATLARASAASRAWRHLLCGGLREHWSSSEEKAAATKCPQYRLWQWTLRWGQGPSARQRLGFWRWTFCREGGVSGCSAASGPQQLQELVMDVAAKVDMVGLVVLSSSLAGICPGSSLAAHVLSRVRLLLSKGHDGGIEMPADLVEGLLAAPLDCRRLWLLSGDALAWLVLRARCFQVVIAAHQPKLFRHFMAEGLAPELFFCKWLLTLFADCADDQDLLRIWDSFVFERSYKVLVRTAVALFTLLEEKLRGDVDQMVEALLKPQQWNLQPGTLWRRALETKVTRAMFADCLRGEQVAAAGSSP